MVKDRLRIIRDAFLGVKIFINRSGSYISLINLGMIMFLTLAQLKTAGIISFSIGSYTLPLYIITLILLAIFGYVDIRFLKGLHTETELINRVTPLHPDLVEIKNKVDYLYEKEMRRNK